MFRRKRSTEDFAEEIRSHIELEAEELQREGLSEENARWQARRKFGNVRAAQERFYLHSRWAWLDRLLRDLRIGLHSLLGSPGFTITVILTLALGVGANTAVFSVMNAVMLRSLPVADANRVVYLRMSHPPHGTGTIDSTETFSYATYDALRRQAGALSAVIAYVPLSGNKVGVRYGAEPEEAEGDMVSGTFFSGLRVKLLRGHGFTEQDEKDHAPIAVISYDYWTRRFARKPDGYDPVRQGDRLHDCWNCRRRISRFGDWKINRFLGSIAESSRTQCMGQSVERREDVHGGPDVVVSAADRTTESGSYKGTGRGAVAADLSAGGLHRHRLTFAG